MAPKEQIKAEMRRLAAMNRLGAVGLSLVGALKLTAVRQPQVVLAALAEFEPAIVEWFEVVELDSTPIPESEVTKAGA